MRDYIKISWEYNIWAADRLLGAAADLSDGDFLRDLGDGVGSVRSKLAHICGADSVWLGRIEGDSSPVMPPPEEFPSARELRTRQEAIHRRFLEIVNEAEPVRRSRKIAYRNLKGVEFETPLDEILMHVANHGTYHRGQAASLIRRLTGTPPVTDLIEFFRLSPQISAGAPP